MFAAVHVIEYNDENGARHILRVRFIDILGAGAFCFVFKVFDQISNQSFALKIATFDGSDHLAQEVGCLYDLAEVPGVCSTLGSGTIKGHDFAVFHVLEPLLKVVRPHVSFDTLRKWAEQLVDCLKRMHQRGWIHRDIKPENMLLDSSRNIYLTDFGFAVRQGNTSGFRGTPEFASNGAYSGHQPVLEDDLESLCWSLLYLESGKVWPTPPERPSLYLSVKEQSPIVAFVLKLWEKQSSIEKEQATKINDSKILFENKESQHVAKKPKGKNKKVKKRKSKRTKKRIK